MCLDLTMFCPACLQFVSSPCSIFEPCSPLPQTASKLGKTDWPRISLSGLPQTSWSTHKIICTQSVLFPAELGPGSPTRSQPAASLTLLSGTVALMGRDWDKQMKTPPVGLLYCSSALFFLIQQLLDSCTLLFSGC